MNDNQKPDFEMEFDARQTEKALLLELIQTLGGNVAGDKIEFWESATKKSPDYFQWRFKDRSFVEGACFGMAALLRHSNLPAFLTHIRDNFHLFQVIIMMAEAQEVGGMRRKPNLK